MSANPRYLLPGTDPAEMQSIEEVHRALLIIQDTIAALIEGNTPAMVVQMMRDERDCLESRLCELAQGATGG